MISESFDREAMEKKIELNLKEGFSIPKIKILLREEQLSISKQIQTCEARAVELQDQIEYMEQREKE